MGSYNTNIRMIGLLPFIVHIVKVEKINFQVKKCPKKECFWPIGKNPLRIDPQKGGSPLRGSKYPAPDTKKMKIDQKLTMLCSKNLRGTFSLDLTISSF